MQQRVKEVLENLYGKTVVITGALSVSRDNLKRLFVDYGALVHGSVNHKTDLVIFGREPGSKLEFAERYGVPIVTGTEVVEFMRSKGHFLPDRPDYHAEDPLFHLPDEAVAAMARPQPAFEDTEMRQLESLARRKPEFIQQQFLTDPRMAMFASGNESMRLAEIMQAQVQRQVEDALVNMIACIILQLGLSEMEVSNIVRETVKQGSYTVDAVHTAAGVKFILTDNG